MAFIKAWIHFVWTTKNRKPLLLKGIKEQLVEHIKENASAKNIYIDSINGSVEHIHLLISLRANHSISEVARLLKGESSHWINNQKLLKTKFDWQDDYFAISVSESVVSKVRNYIRNQEEHHRIKPFSEEYDMFISKYGF